MVDLASLKLNKIIEILEKEVKIRRYYKTEMKKRNKNSLVDVVDEDESSTSEEEEQKTD
jgi:hypothetical protein